jgi:nucleotide-binding universal stress UspA family protein
VHETALKEPVTQGRREATEEMWAMRRKILVPLDGSRVAEIALPQVLELARALQAEVLLLRVARARAFPGVDPTEKQVRAVQEAEAYVEAVAEQMRHGGVPVRAAVRFGDPVAEIFDHIRSNGVDFVAMVTRGRGRLCRMVLGSVAEEVVRRAGIPVLLVRMERESEAQVATGTVAGMAGRRIARVQHPAGVSGVPPDPG